VIGLATVELLDILGNENRRRILQLLSFRPFYFNEMAKRLDLGPKAVINHLDMLERAGLIECYHDDRRRKYFRISENFILEVALAPHTYGVRTYRPACALDESPSPKVQEEVSTKSKGSCNGSQLRDLRSKFMDLENRRFHLRRLLDEIEYEEMTIKRQAIDLIEECAEDLLEEEVLIALTPGPSRSKNLANRLRMPEAVVVETLNRLASRNTVQKKGYEWTI